MTPPQKGVPFLNIDISHIVDPWWRDTWNIRTSLLLKDLILDTFYRSVTFKSYYTIVISQIAILKLYDVWTPWAGSSNTDRNYSTFAMKPCNFIGISLNMFLFTGSLSLHHYILAIKNKRCVRKDKLFVFLHF